MNCCYFLLPKHFCPDATNKEEEEVRKMIRECLELRQRYLYRENVSPWMKIAVENSSSSKMKKDPFHFEPVEASAVSHSLLIYSLLSLSSVRHM